MKVFQNIFYILFSISTVICFGQNNPKIKKKVEHSSLWKEGMHIYYYDKKGNSTLYFRCKNNDTLQCYIWEYDENGNRVMETTKSGGINSPILNQTKYVYIENKKKYSYVTWQMGIEVSREYYDTLYYKYNSNGEIINDGHLRESLNYNKDSTLKAKKVFMNNQLSSECFYEYDTKKREVLRKCYKENILTYIVTTDYLGNVATEISKDVKTNEKSKRIITYDEYKNIISIEKYNTEDKLISKVSWEIEYY